MSHYKVLGLAKTATKPEIKAAFRKSALKFHPDKHSHSPQPVRDASVHRFKQVSEAYQVLVDDTKRARYDQRVTRRDGEGGTTSSGNGGATDKRSHTSESRKNPNSYSKTYHWESPFSGESHSYSKTYHWESPFSGESHSYTYHWESLFSGKSEFGVRSSSGTSSKVGSKVYKSTGSKASKAHTWTVDPVDACVISFCIVTGAKWLWNTFMGKQSNSSSSK